MWDLSRIIEYRELELWSWKPNWKGIQEHQNVIEINIENDFLTISCKISHLIETVSLKFQQLLDYYHYKICTHPKNLERLSRLLVGNWKKS